MNVTAVLKVQHNNIKKTEKPTNTQALFGHWKELNAVFDVESIHDTASCPSPQISLYKSSHWVQYGLSYKDYLSVVSSGYDNLQLFVPQLKGLDKDNFLHVSLRSGPHIASSCFL